MPRSRVSQKWAEALALVALAACTPAAPEMAPAEREARNVALTERQMQLLSTPEAGVVARYGQPASVTPIDRGERVLRFEHPDCALLVTANDRGEVLETAYDATPGDVGLLACAHWL